MYIEHIALWTNHLEHLRDFYVTYFRAMAGDKYCNPTTHFDSYFLSFSGEARLELMNQPGIQSPQADPVKLFAGYTHLSFATGSEQAVDELTQRLQQGGFTVMDGPRRTGDGYYESVVLDPDGNRIEITA